MSDRPTTDKEWDEVERRKPKRRTCSYCGREGHVAKDCPELLNRRVGE